jgi:hypothetical protein
MSRRKQKEIPYTGYFYSSEVDEEGEQLCNVVGRFADHEIVDRVATEEAEKAGHIGRNRVMKTIVVLFERVLKDAADQMSKDEVPTRVTPRNSSELIARYPDAWESYQATKKQAAKKQERKPRSKRAEISGGAEIVELQAARG